MLQSRPLWALVLLFNQLHISVLQTLQLVTPLLKNIANYLEGEVNVSNFTIPKIKPWRFLEPLFNLNQEEYENKTTPNSDDVPAYGSRHGSTTTKTARMPSG